jgi:choline transport protein
MLTWTDYCIVAFAIIIIISTVQWFVDGRKNFTGPRHDVNLEVLEAVQSEQVGPEDATSRKIDDGL